MKRVKKLSILTLLLFFFLSIASPSLANAFALKRPLFSFPVIVRVGDAFKIECEAEEETKDWQVFLSHEYRLTSLEVKQAKYVKERALWDIKVTVPKGLPEEIYDLMISSSSGEDTQPRAVKVIFNFKKEFYFVHLTDTHIGCSGQFVSKGFPDSKAILKKIVEEVNLINPEFVLITGDLIHCAEDVGRILLNYKAPHMTQTDEGIKAIMEKEYNDFLDIISKFKVPVFIIPGNHDMVGLENPLAKEYYEKVIGPRYYSFDYSDYHFTGLDNSNMMEATPICYGREALADDLDKEQLIFLEDDLKKNQDKRLRIIFFHVPIAKTKSQFKALAEKYNVDLALCGHLHRDHTVSKTKPIWIETKSSLDFGGYRLIRLKDDKIASYGGYKGDRKASLWAYNLDLSYFPQNNGKFDQITAAITNKTEEYFENALLRFIMPRAGEYQVTGGNLAQEVICKDKKICYVEVNIPKESTIKVTIKSK